MEEDEPVGLAQVTHLTVLFATLLGLAESDPEVWVKAADDVRKARAIDIELERAGIAYPHGLGGVLALIEQRDAAGANLKAVLATLQRRVEEVRELRGVLRQILEVCQVSAESNAKARRQALAEITVVASEHVWPDWS